MDQQTAQELMTHIVAPAFELFVERRNASLLELDFALLALSNAVSHFPNISDWPDDAESSLDYAVLSAEISRHWPELGLYDLNTGEGLTDHSSEIGDAIDDLADIALDLGRSLEIAHVNVSGAVSQLRFWYDAHWDDHAADLRKHLTWLLNK
ncbi:hypothetical protein EHF33_11925 [Deinococcus psychrotolerans]|uniref:DUF5063 domain-containing protein n=1 Tax=Deinococcus psychrotolerans TaxID=2489213 RepID=A0A3G8YEH9_9DEIO|nr:hypothetical protein [Deinococcus psychrotolerans]AZI43363.1 hypothetical protein EHF33_11925 [Deinococcus psychrotolerans]